MHKEKLGKSRSSLSSYVSKQFSERTLAVKGIIHIQIPLNRFQRDVFDVKYTVITAFLSFCLKLLTCKWLGCTIKCIHIFQASAILFYCHLSKFMWSTCYLNCFLVLKVDKEYILPYVEIIFYQNIKVLFQSVIEGCFGCKRQFYHRTFSRAYKSIDIIQ